MTGPDEQDCFGSTNTADRLPVVIQRYSARWGVRKNSLPCLDVGVTPDSAGHAEAFRHLARIHCP